jgi:hypothetical protein
VEQGTDVVGGILLVEDIAVQALEATEVGLASLFSVLLRGVVGMTSKNLTSQHLPFLSYPHSYVPVWYPYDLVDEWNSAIIDQDSLTYLGFFQSGN